MRMRFTRVEEKSLPKANGVGVKVTDETPDTVDLRNVVSRMRAMNGPDISSFQNAYTASIEVPGNAPMADDFNDASTFGRTGFEPASEIAEPAVEPYNPTMLPRMEPANPQLERFNQIRSQLLSDEPVAGPRPDPYRTPPRTAPSFAQPNADQPRPSLRESLLKKPLSSIIRK